MGFILNLVKNFFSYFLNLFFYLLCQFVFQAVLKCVRHELLKPSHAQNWSFFHADNLQENWCENLTYFNIFQYLIVAFISLQKLHQNANTIEIIFGSFRMRLNSKSVSLVKIRKCFLRLYNYDVPVHVCGWRYLSCPNFEMLELQMNACWMFFMR